MRLVVHKAGEVTLTEDTHGNLFHGDRRLGRVRFLYGAYLFDPEPRGGFGDWDPCCPVQGRPDRDAIYEALAVALEQEGTARPRGAGGDR